MAKILSMPLIEMAIYLLLNAPPVTRRNLSKKRISGVEEYSDARKVPVIPSLKFIQKMEFG
jgi:hypothetical protein